MAPLAADLHSWVTGGGPLLTVLAFVFLCIIIINLIHLCTTCQKQSFELEHEGMGVERNSSTLVRVVKLEDALAAAGRENPDIDEIKKDEQELGSVPEEGVPATPTQANGEAYTAWRNHSTSALPEETQVGNGAPVGTSGANGGGGGGNGIMDGTTTTRHKLQAIPVIALHNEGDSGMQYAPPAVSEGAGGAPDHSKSAGSSQDWAGAQPVPTANHTGEVFQEPLDSLRVPAIRSQHTYETLSDMVKDPSPELSSPTANHTGEVSQEPLDSLRVPKIRSQHTYETLSDMVKDQSPELSSESPDEPLDVPSYEFVTQLEPYATSAPDLTEPQHMSAHSPPVEVEEIPNLPEPKHTSAHSLAIEVEEIAELEDRHTKALYARVSRRIKCPTPPPVPPPEDDEEEEEVAEVVPPLPDRAPDTDNTLPQGL